jgi:hypothetical protein
MTADRSVAVPLVCASLLLVALATAASPKTFAVKAGGGEAIACRTAETIGELRPPRAVGIRDRSSLVQWPGVMLRRPPEMAHQASKEIRRRAEDIGN